MIRKILKKANFAKWVKYVNTPDHWSDNLDFRTGFCLIFFLVFFLSFSIHPVEANEPVNIEFGLYKDGQMTGIEFEKVAPFSYEDIREATTMEISKGKMLRERVLGKKALHTPDEIKTYYDNVIKCRDLVIHFTTDEKIALISDNRIEQLAALGERLSWADQALLVKFETIKQQLINDGYSKEKIDRHTRMVENHRQAAEKLLSLLSSLTDAYNNGDRTTVYDVSQKLLRYFEENIFQYDPPFYNAAPLPVIMDTQEAPVRQINELPPASTIPYPVASGILLDYDPADLEETIDVQFTDDISNLADSLNNSAVEIYSYVRNNFEFEPYLGSRKGSQQTLDHRRGSDYDQASLLIALLRVSGIPARYATGEVEMPTEMAKNWLGIDNAYNAGSILTTAGMEGVIVLSGEDTVAIRCQRVWVEAWLPYINYRGTVNDSAGSIWVPLDPTFKQYDYTSSINLMTEIDFDSKEFVDDYISTFHEEPPIELFKQMMLDSLAVYHPGASYEDLIRHRSVIKETDGIIPGTLPYKLLSLDGQFSEISSDKRYYIRFHVYGSGTDLDYTTSLPEIVQKQVTISYIGATTEDQAIIDSAGGIFNVENPYLVDLKPVLKIDGCEVATGTGEVMMGITHNSDMHFTAPTGASNVMPLVSNVIIAGNYQGIGIDTEDAIPTVFGLPETSCDEEFLGQELHQTALTYLNSVDIAGDELAGLMHQIVMNDISEAIVENSITVMFSGVLPVSFDWTGMIVDADRKVIGPFSVAGVDNKCDYMRLGGTDGSIQENRLFEIRFDEEAISTIKILELASDSGITICEISTSIAADCPGIDQPQSVIDAINDALAQGHHVIIPERGFTYYNWTGTGWIDIDTASCAAGYIISGGQNGGATVQEWDITYPDLFCIEPIGPITVTPSATSDIYCADNTASWTFTVPTIKYWGKDSEGVCELLTTVTNKNFPVQYTIKHIADTWGAGAYVFKCGSNTTDCGCTMIQKEVTIVKVEITGDSSVQVCATKNMTATGEPSGGTLQNWTSSETGVATIVSNTGALTAATLGTTNITVEYSYNGVICESEPYTVTIEHATLSDIGDWNDGGTVQNSNNCYNYATDIRTNTFAQPGRANGHSLSFPVTCAQVNTGATLDGLVSVSISDLNDLCGQASQLANGGHIVALIAGDQDYHWYRMDADGTWTHKPGGTPATNVDANGSIITDPQTAAWSSIYTDFCGFYYVGTGVGIQ